MRPVLRLAAVRNDIKTVILMAPKSEFAGGPGSGPSRKLTSVRLLGGGPGPPREQPQSDFGGGPGAAPHPQATWPVLLIVPAVILAPVAVFICQMSFGKGKAPVSDAK